MATILNRSPGGGFARIEGLAQLESNLKILREEFGVKTGGIIIRGLRAGARLIRDEARARAPHVPSGYARAIIARAQRSRSKKAPLLPAQAVQSILRSNIVEHAIPVKSRLAGGQPTVLVRVRNHGYFRLNGAIRFNRPASAPGWWWWVEFGTSKRPAQPFLRPAFESQKVAAAESFKRHVRGEIDQMFGKLHRRAA